MASVGDDLIWGGWFWETGCWSGTNWSRIWLRTVMCFVGAWMRSSLLRCVQVWVTLCDEGQRLCWNFELERLIDLFERILRLRDCVI